MVDGFDMSLTLIEIDGNLYHTQDIYDEEGENVIDTSPILDEDGDMIPASVCLCYAYEPSECVCATTSWEDWDYVEGVLKYYVAKWKEDGKVCMKYFSVSKYGIDAALAKAIKV